MSENVCNYSFKQLEETTVLDKMTISSMVKGNNLTKINVISVCLGIHISSKVIKKMLNLAKIDLNLDLPGRESIENNIYNILIHFKWASDYSDIYNELQNLKLEYFIQQPKM